MSGLAVLQHLTTNAVDTPVLVVTGFADIESAVAAIKLGAVDYKVKPIIGDDFVHAIRTLVSTVSPTFAFNGTDPDRNTRRTTSASALEETARRLVTPSIGILEFISLARSFRRLIGNPDNQQTDPDETTSCTPQETALATDLLGQVAHALSRGTLPQLDGLAQQTSVPADYISRLLKALTNSDFHECRRSLRIRPIVPEVASSHEQIAQIAYRHGYEWPGQLDRDFKATLLLTPTAFRRLFLTRLSSLRRTRRDPTL